MHRTRKRLSDLDRETWASYASRLTPLKGHSILPLLPRPPAKPEVIRPVSTTPRIHAPARDWLTIGQPPAGLDRSSWQRFRSGRQRVTHRLDLHGFTAQHAFDRFELFLGHSVGQGLRCVEVVTGRGSGEYGGVLRRELPVWLNLPHLRPLVLAATYPHATNDGAVLLLLRRYDRK